MNRRKFLQGSAALAGTGLLTGLYTWQIEPHWVEFVNRNLPIKNLPKHLSGKTLVQFSDIHVGPFVNDWFLIDSFELTKLLNPDIVVYTGDFVHYEGTKTRHHLADISKYFAKGKLGTFGILGNHDYGDTYSDEKVAANLIDILEGSGISVLRNEHKEIEGFNIMGLDDYWGTNFFPRNALNGYDSEIGNLVLCHNPDACDATIWGDYKGWILSGHTHGGQVRPPLMNAPILPIENKRYVAGEVKLHDGRTLYVNRALGHQEQLRFNVRPEITVFKLMST
ncbi:metallophosphoesterase [Croceivirga thetidis]|uniref:Twin-arginine translocation signal domain-containing protein n=1 Tax=Croceivirga thetidis TaxID=2721623 RepID=A0ABX1GUH4_9FLAO|nr:metallophosphoesterase [Croceivirga thetidis]NKI33289.1 twin-arginine translocation signal domain-containing protein [Croceivirga thetidis]